MLHPHPFSQLPTPSSLAAKLTPFSCLKPLHGNLHVSQRQCSTTKLLLRNVRELHRPSLVFKDCEGTSPIVRASVAAWTRRFTVFAIIECYIHFSQFVGGNDMLGSLIGVKRAFFANLWDGVADFYCARGSAAHDCSIALVDDIVL
jgi:hypothetical protein